MKSHVTFALLALVLLHTVVSMTGFAQKLDKTLDAMIRKEYPADEPGATVLVAKEGEVLYCKAFGMANMELDVPMKPEMIFEIGSITKQFTAISILMLMEEGKLSLDDEITKFIEDYPTHGHRITIHHLLTHTSGIKDFTEVAETWKRIRLDHSPKELIDLFKNQPMDFSPGEKYMYNNSGYFILGYIIEKVSDISYPEFIEKNIFEPLGMNNSYCGNNLSIIKNRAYGYQKQDDSFANAEYFSHTNSFAAGSIMSTLDDMFIWNIAINEYKIVSKESLDKAYTNYTLINGDPINYGYGWSLREINGSPTVEHGGFIFGYTTNGIYLPGEKVYVAMLSNRDDKRPEAISTRIAAIAIGKPYHDQEDRIEVDPEILKGYVGVYEFEDDYVRYIKFEEGQLFSQRKGSTNFKIFPMKDGEFMYDGTLSTIKFTKNADGTMEAIFKNRISVIKGKRTTTEIPVKKEMEVPLP